MDPEQVIPFIASVAYDYFGVSGRYRLDGAGDQVSSHYQIWGHGDIGSDVQHVLYGVCDDVCARNLNAGK